MKTLKSGDTVKVVSLPKSILDTNPIGKTGIILSIFQSDALPLMVSFEGNDLFPENIWYLNKQNVKPLKTKKSCNQ